MIQTAFNGGEITSLAHGRPELTIYPTACKRMENFRALMHGGATRDPGTQHLTEPKDNNRCRLKDLEIDLSQGLRFMAEYTEEAIRFHTTGDVVTTLDQVLNTPYLTAELREIQTAQLNRFVTHSQRNHAPQFLSFEDTGLFSWKDYPFSFPPLRDQNTDEDHTMTYDGETGLISSEDFFENGHVGAQFEIAHKRTVAQSRITEDIDGDSTSAAIVVDGGFTLQTFGNWTARIVVEESQDDGETYDDILFFESTADANFSPADLATSSRSLLRIRIENYSSDGEANNPRVVLTASDPFVRGTVKVTAVTSATVAVVDEMDDTRTEATYLWSEAAFSDFRGWPSAVTYHRQRLLFAGTAAQPQKVWASRIDNFDDFRRPSGTDEAADADAAFTFNIVSESQNRIEFMVSQRELVVGTSNGEWIVAGDQQTGAFGPGAFHIVPLSYNGSAGVQPIKTEEGVVFLQREARKVRHIGALTDVVYSPQDLPDELSLYGEHLIRDGVVEHCYQRSPDPIYWAVTTNGLLAGYTHKPSQKVLAWHRHVLGKNVKVESIASTYTEKEEDQVWLSLAIKQEDGSEYRTIERYALGQRQAQEKAEGALDDDGKVIDQSLLAEAFRDFRFLNHSRELAVVKGEDIELDGLGFLEGKTVTCILDGVKFGADIIVDGSISFEAPASGNLVYGVHVPPMLETLPPTMQTQEGVVGFLTESQIGRVHILPWRSAKAIVSTSATSRKRTVGRRPAAVSFDRFPSLSSKPDTVDGLGGNSDRPTIQITVDEPLPFTLLALNYQLEATEQT